MNTIDRHWKARPIGISLLAGFLWLNVVVLILGGTFLLSSRSGPFLYFGIAVVIIFALIYGACAIGLWHLSNWARWTVIFLSIALGLRWYSRILILAPSVGIVCFLMLPSTRRAFLKTRKAADSAVPTR